MADFQWVKLNYEVVFMWFKRFMIVSVFGIHQIHWFFKNVDEEDSACHYK